MSNISEIIGKLDYLCKQRGSDSPIGSRASNLSQQIQNLPPGPDERIEYLTSDSTKQQREALLSFIATTQAEIAQIMKDGGEYIPEHHNPRGSA